MSFQTSNASILCGYGRAKALDQHLQVRAVIRESVDRNLVLHYAPAHPLQFLQHGNCESYAGAGRLEGFALDRVDLLIDLVEALPHKGAIQWQSRLGRGEINAHLRQLAVDARNFVADHRLHVGNLCLGGRGLLGELAKFGK